MPINPNSLVSQLERQAPHLQQIRRQQQEELPQALAQYRATRREDWLTLEELARGKQAGALPVEELDSRPALDAAPSSYIVVATDGSAIPPDRHGGMAFCHVINIGEVALGYGDFHKAHIESDTRLYLVGGGGKEAAIPGEDEEDADSEINAQLLMMDVQLSVDELAVALELADEHKATVVLRDGPLTLWASSILNNKEGRALTGRYLQLLDQFTERNIPVVGYTSNSRSDAVVTALRMMGHRRYRGLLDGDLFWQLLAPGECSPAFRHSARHPKDAALTEQIYFRYFRTEDELVRLEFSRDFLGTPELDIALSIIWKQVQLGQGYPVALMEAHESAVLRSADRELLRVMLESYGLVTKESQKGLSKRLRGI